jgi:uncharacterized protein
MLLRCCFFRGSLLGWVVALWLGTAPAWAAGSAPVGDACPPEPELPNRVLMLKAQQQAADRGFLWRLSRGGRDSFLYGTLHAGRPEWFALGPQTEAALSRTGVLALEINVTDPAEQSVFREAMQAPPRALPPALAQGLAAAWRAECLPMADLARGAAELHVMQLGAAQAQRRGLFALYGAETVLLMRSLRVQRPVMGLESARTQLSALLARTVADAAVLVGAALAELQRGQTASSIDRLTSVWASGDAQALDSYGEWCDCLNSDTERAAFARLVDARNPGMADAIEQTHAQVSVFAAVGMLHVAGPQGLPALLRARGFAVTRVF